MLHGLIDVSSDTPIWHFQFVILVPSCISWHEIAFLVLNTCQKMKVASKVGIGLDSVLWVISWCRSNSGYPTQ